MSMATANDRPLTIRFPSGSLLKRLAEEATKNGRSRNSEIIVRLEQSLGDKTDTDLKQHGE